MTLNTNDAADRAYMRAALALPLAGRNGRETAIAGLPSPKHLSTSSVTGYTYTLKREAEADYDRVRFHFLNFTDADVTDLKAVCASTETDSVSSAANRSQPIVGGVTYNALAASEDAPGWRAVTFQSASPGTIPARKGGSSAYRPGVLTSDWIACPSVPRADGGTRPLVMIRAYSAGAPTVFNGLITDVAGGGFNSGILYAWNSASSVAETWYRACRTALSTSAVDGVADLTVTGNASNSGPAVLIEFGYRKRAITVLGVGDSLLAVADNGKFSTAGFRACAAMAADDVPAHYVNYADAGELSVIFQGPGFDAMTTFRPDIVLHHLYSPNDGTPNATRINLALGRLRSVLAHAAVLGITVVVRSAMPVSSWDATATGFLDTLNASAQAMADDGLFLFANLVPTLTTGASPNRLVPAMTPDGTHFNDDGLDAEAAILKPLFLQVA
jgi:hypothetical protein